MIKKNQGFTLIELLTVIAIIGILSTIVYASLNGARVKARDSVRVADATAIANALDYYYTMNNRTYPIEQGVFNSNSWGDLGNKLAPTYLIEMPASPLGGRAERDMRCGQDCHYFVVIQGQNYKVSVELSDGSSHVISKGCSNSGVNTTCN